MVDSGQWTVDRGQRTVDSGQRTADIGQWTVDAINKRNHLFSEWPEKKYGNKRGINHLLIK